jgi:hypothetical protein
MTPRQAPGARHPYGVKIRKKPRQDPRAIVESLTSRELALRGGRAVGHGQMRESNY